MNKEAVIYHWWGYGTDAPPISNLRSPILASIATLRSLNQSVPIYVIDVSEEEQNWMHYPEKFNFKLIKQKPFLEKNYSHCQGYRNLSRTFDINRLEIPEDILIYVDSDVFFIKDPLPLNKNTNKFCFNKYNSGFYYFNKNSEEYLRFKEVFESYIITALNDENFRCVTKQFGSCDDYFVLDETLMYFMYIKHRELIDVIQPTEHFTINIYDNRHEYDEFKLNDVKMFHGNGIMVNNKFAKNKYEEKYSRGLICLGLSQLHQNITRALGSDIEQMFTKEERDAYLNKQVDFDENFVKKIHQNKGETGHYYFSEIILTND